MSDIPSIYRFQSDLGMMSMLKKYSDVKLDQNTVASHLHLKDEEAAKLLDMVFGISKDLTGDGKIDKADLSFYLCNSIPETNTENNLVLDADEISRAQKMLTERISINTQGNTKRKKH